MSAQAAECPCGSSKPFFECHGAPEHAASPYVPVDGIAQNLEGLGFERVQVMPGSTYKDSSTIIIVPTRDPKIHHRVFQTWQTLIAPMNQKRHMMIVVGDEVGIAYNQTVANILAHPELSQWKYIMTMESDNLQPVDAHIRLLEAIEMGRFDGVSGLYFTKGDINQPMCYGDPAQYAQTGVLDFKPLDIRDALTKGQIVECNGIANGCSLYRMELFRQVPPPWFVTVADVIEGKGVMGFTQDLFFCQKARLMGKRFAVDMRVRVGHLDEKTGLVY